MESINAIISSLYLKLNLLKLSYLCTDNGKKETEDT